MGAQAPLLAPSLPRLLSRSPQLLFSHVSPPSLKCSPKVVAFKGMVSKQDVSSGPTLVDPCASWSSTTNESSRSMGLLEGTCAGTRWVGLLLYRALLVGGIGLSLGHPAVARAASAPPDLVSQESITNQKAAEKSSQKTEEKGAHNDAEGSLGAEFWKGMDLTRGSAELILKKVLDGDPMNLSALECLARILMDSDDYSRALLVLEKLEISQPNELEWKYMKAEAHDMEGQSQLAKKIFEDILKVEPFSSRALQGLVLAMDQLDESDSALKILEDTWVRAKRENNRVEAGNFGMLIGQLYTFKGRMQDALQHYNGMLEEDANDFRPYICQGIIYSVLGDTDMADKQFQTFEKLCPKDLPDREFFNGLMSRARKEGRRIFEFKQKQKAKAATKGGKGG